MRLVLRQGDCVEKIKELETDSVDSVLCDPPYGLKFEIGDFDDLGDGRQQVDWHILWVKEVHRVLKPEGILRAFSGSRTVHYLLAAMAEVGFKSLQVDSWHYVNGFPKSQDIAKDLDRLLGYEREKIKVPLSEVRNPKSIMGGHGVKGSERPWMREARKNGYHLKDSPNPVSPEAKSWVSHGTNLKPSFEPICVGYKQ